MRTEDGKGGGCFHHGGTEGTEDGEITPTTRDFTAEAAENAENGRKQGNGRRTTGERPGKTQRSSPFSASSAISAVKK